jgi:uncharacterized protein YabE (DUF348 family)
VQRSVKYGFYGLVVAAVVGGPVAMAATERTVSLVVDGQTQVVATQASTVAGALADAGYNAGPHDIVAPEPDAAVHDGSRIVLRRARVLLLNVDGHRSRIWTTAPTVASALDQLGYTNADFASVSRSKRLPLTPTDIAVRTPKQVTLVHDGTRQRVSTTAAVVRDLLADLDIPVRAHDRLSVPTNAAVRDGQNVTLTRVDRKQVTTMKRVPFATRRILDPHLASGRTQVIKPGRAGLMRVQRVSVFVNGVLTARSKPNHLPHARARQGLACSRAAVRTQPAAVLRVERRAVELPQDDVDPRERLERLRREPRQRRLRHPAGATGQQDGARLAGQRRGADQVGAALRQAALRLPVRRLVVLAAGQLVLARDWAA